MNLSLFIDLIKALSAGGGVVGTLTAVLLVCNRVFHWGLNEQDIAAFIASLLGIIGVVIHKQMVTNALNAPSPIQQAKNEALQQQNTALKVDAASKAVM